MIRVDLSTSELARVGLRAGTSLAKVSLNERGAPGTNGATAYQIAVANGFVGSEAQWLASLVGPAGDSVIEDPGDLTLIFDNGLI